MTESVFIALGSNLGNRVEHLKKAVNRLSTTLGSPTQASSFYETEPWGKSEQPLFINQVIVWKSSLSPTDLLKILLDVEYELGRTRTEKWGARSIDLDLLYVGGQILTTPQLQLPHPGIPDRRFVLVPLTEIAPGFVHPILNVNHTQLLARCKDPLMVNRVSET